MHSTRSLKVCCGIWHQDVSTRSFKSCPLRVVVPTESVSSYMGDTALLRCEVTGEPMPVVRWQKNRDELPLTFDPDSRVVVLPSGSLQVSKVQPPDAATYRCLAENPGSARTGTDADLRVLPGVGGKSLTVLEGRKVQDSMKEGASEEESSEGGVQ
ncbi:hypothetical protein QTP70_006016 [Hemibagrus guttatus]|uniref:Ig-like domain-containing protein n=1 Tax=Hemibagrus guttatus TaxID=175788 RepID=A0AAE0PV54_9TELE|nr:hypothetical protein QTP70_006016 [Hemibagrus guttatus]